MKIKSKKGAVLLLLSSLAFLLTVFLLANYQLKTDFLGKKQAELLDVANKGESALLYIDQMAKLSLAETWGSEHPRIEGKHDFSEKFKTVDNFKAGKHEFKNVFDSEFKNRLKTFNELYEQDLKYGLGEGGVRNFEIAIKPFRAPNTQDKLGGLEIIGKANKKIIMQTSSIGTPIKYSITPNFHITLTLKELNSLK